MRHHHHHHRVVLAAALLVCCLYAIVGTPSFALTVDHHSSLTVASQQQEKSLRGTPRDPIGFSGDWTATDDQTIFIAVAAYRDVLCQVTVDSIFRKAANPRRLFLGIIEQSEHGDPTCIPDEFYDCRSTDFCPIDNIRRRRVAAQKGRGPTYGRFVSSMMWRGEAFLMSVDSHQLTSRHFDRLSLGQLLRSRSSRPAHTGYPNVWDKMSDVGPDGELTRGLDHEAAGNVMVMCNGHFLKQLGYIRMDSAWMDRRIEPFPCPFSAAGYIFADSLLAMHDVPFDPHLNYLFDGEEIAYSARVWTAGWDWFTPGGGSGFWHDYSRHICQNAAVARRQKHKRTGTEKDYKHVACDKGDKPSERYWNIKSSRWGYEIPKSQQRVQYMLKSHKFNSSTEYLVPRDTTLPHVLRELDKYGLGKQRSIEEYNRYAKIDDVKYKADFSFCSMLQPRQKYSL